MKANETDYNVRKDIKSYEHVIFEHKWTAIAKPRCENAHEIGRAACRWQN